jgi:hypothetical protein
MRVTIIPFFTTFRDGHEATLLACGLQETDAMRLRQSKSQCMACRLWPLVAHDDLGTWHGGAAAQIADLARLTTEKISELGAAQIIYSVTKGHMGILASIGWYTARRA